MTRRRWIALAVLGALVVGLVVTVVLVRSGDDASEASAPVYHQGDTVKVANGDEFVIALPANPSTGSSWTASDNANVEFVSSRPVSGGSQPGAGGTQELTFRADHAGASTLELAYSRSFEQSGPTTKTARFPVTVTK